MTDTTGDVSFGLTVPDTPATAPSRDARLLGQYVTVVALEAQHAQDMYSLVEGTQNTSLFAYLFDEPPTSAASFEENLAGKASSTNPWFYSIILNGTPESSSRPVGYASLMRMDLPNRVIEVGNILFTSALQRTPAATEAMYLLARYVFEDLGFRRYEWKCNSLNAPSRRAAERLGFTYEGTFRQHMIARGRNRDTAWFSMLDSEWTGVKRGFEGWLDASNFDSDGKQRRTLGHMRSA
jgi:RimJ/RimL family protein N-acetyltransferase